MMQQQSDVAIAVSNLSKRYRIYGSPTHRLMERITKRAHPSTREVSALEDVNFEILRGQSVGVIGRNGSGKSTLLQIIAGTLPPTEGDIQVNGRVSAMLELGTGFNPDFTGRENIYVAGAIQGFDREKIDNLFDGIAGFADIGEYMERPLKTYSTGMVMRLAFASAVAADPDILIVDEALAVGDEAFQRKCAARIDQIQSNGATILIVTHSGRQVIELCDHAVLLDGGALLYQGLPKVVIGAYQRMLYASAEKSARIRTELRELAPGEIPNSDDDSRKPVAKSKPDANVADEAKDDGRQEALLDQEMAPESRIVYESHGAVISDVHLTTPGGERVNLLRLGESYEIRYRILFEEAAEFAAAGTLIKTVVGVELAAASTARLDDEGIGDVEANTEVEVAWNFTCRLLPGTYFVNAGTSAMVNGQRIFLHRVLDGAMFKVLPEPDLHVDGFLDVGFKPRITRRQMTERGL
jgi:lipopolysaccharide transport system ATP-binding protein